MNYSAAALVAVFLPAVLLTLLSVANIYLSLGLTSVISMFIAFFKGFGAVYILMLAGVGLEYYNKSRKDQVRFRSDKELFTAITPLLISPLIGLVVGYVIRLTGER